jgi:FkbM family methyltransferase
VGGNIGQFASALRYIGYGGDILTFEPIPDVFTALSDRMRGDKRWRGVQIAIGDHVGYDTLNVMAHPEYSSFRSRVTENENPSDTVVERLRVPVQTLESVIEEMHLGPRLPMTLIKSNTQGHELSVLQGLRKYIQAVKLIQCELFSIPLYQDSPFMTEIVDFCMNTGSNQSHLHRLTANQFGQSHLTIYVSMTAELDSRRWDNASFRAMAPMPHLMMQYLRTPA